MSEEFAVDHWKKTMKKEVKLHQVLKRLMDDKKISARELSRQTKVPPSTLSSLLSGGKPQKLEHVLSIAEYFCTSMEFLLFGADKKAPTLEDVLTEHLFSGWLKVSIERAIPDKRKGGSNEEK